MNTGSSFRYIPALDGMRALAVLSVLFYHADVAFLSGGFLGVELFFVVSGYLITSLLLHERAEHGRTDLMGFWRRRARRLLPALWTVLGVVPAYAALALPEELFGLREDELSAFFYVTNWQLIFSGQSYFEQVGRPPLLTHLWSLAVEEQFYIVWPLVFTWGLVKLSRRARVLLLGAACLASAAWMLHLVDPQRDPSRVYYGSDTRAFGILFGATLACALFQNPLAPRLRKLLAHTSLPALLALVGLCVGLDELTPWLYPGGLLAVDAASVLLIAAVTETPHSGVGRALSVAPLRALGQRSYSLYLWHWPVFAVTRPGLDQALEGVPLLLMRLGVTFALAEASYRWIERPLRTARTPSPLVVWVKQALTAPSWPKLASAAAAVLLGMFSTHALIFAQEPLLPELTLTTPHTGHAVHASAAPSVRTVTSASLVSPTPAPLRPHVLTIGDSVMLGARRFLRSPDADIEVDAEVGRTPLDTIQLLKKRRKQGRLADVVIIHLGNNGPFQPEQFDRMVELLADVPHVAFVTARVQRRLGVLNNRTIRDGVKRHPELALIDWYEATEGHARWLRDDGLHLREAGAVEYAKLLAAHYLAPGKSR